MANTPDLHPDFIRRRKLYDDSIKCNRVDTLLCAPYLTYLPMLMYKECTIKEAVNDWRASLPSFMRYHKEFMPDMAYGPKSIFPGAAMDALDCKFVKWPGKHFDDDNLGFQVLDGEYMAQEEYLEYAEDPTGFIMRKILPRHYGKYEGLAMLDFSNALWQGGMYATLPTLNPKVKESFDAMIECGKRLGEQIFATNDYFAELAAMGIPSGSDYVTSAPFDIFNDTLRGFLNTTTDIYECPDELLVAVKAATRIQVRQITNMMESRPMKTIGFMLHNGYDTFMSRENFETFYWPGLKECIDVCVAHDVIPWIYVEDSYMNKLDILERDVPEGKVMFTFTGSNDMKAIKERFGGRYCLRGGLTATTLEYGTVDDVIKETKEAIDIYAPGGGYIPDFDVNLDNAKPENLHAFFDTVRSYIKY